MFCGIGLVAFQVGVYFRSYLFISYLILFISILFNFFYINRVGFRVPQESKGDGWVPPGRCRGEGCVQQVKGEERGRTLIHWALEKAVL